jgi:hypothetical protein
MGTSLMAVSARCPLCGSRVLSVNGAGHVLSDDRHPVAMGRENGSGYTLCEDCGVLADLPTDLTLN